MGASITIKTHSRARIIAAGVVGNMLEWYDFSIYGFFAAQIGATFFQSGDRLSETLSAFGVFAMGFLTRPIGSIVIGHVGDRYGRTTALTISIVGMAASSVGMGLLPGYATIGIAAPILLTLMRMLQGLAVGGEASIAGVFMIEHAPKGRRALSGAIGGIGNGLGIQAASLIALALASLLSSEALAAWGWRIPFVLGLIVGVGGFFIRRTLRDMPEQTAESANTPIVALFKDHTPLLLRIAGLACFMAIGFQAAFIYIADWLQTVDGMAPAQAFKINSTSMLLVMPVSLFFGWLADIWGRKPLLLAGAGLGIVGAVPFFMLMQSSSLSMIYLGQMGFVLVIGIQFGMLQAVMVETTPLAIRCTALAVGNNIAWAILGGTTPLVATWLIYRTGDARSPAYLIVAAAAITFVALLMTKDNFKYELGKLKARAAPAE
jgi:MHS family proline/betaine transporter-like MFS transporter